MGEWTKEPWIIKGNRGLIARNEHNLAFADFDNRADGERAVACVNALAGKDPAAVAGLVDTLGYMTTWDCECSEAMLDPNYPTEHKCGSCQAREAIKKWEGK